MIRLPLLTVALAWSLLAGACIPEDLRTLTFQIEESVTVPGKNPLAATGLDRRRYSGGPGGPPLGMRAE